MKPEKTYDPSIIGIRSNLIPHSHGARRHRRRKSPTDISARKKIAVQKEEKLPTNFRDAIARDPPPVPPTLLKIIGHQDVSALGKVRVVLRETPTVVQTKDEKCILSFDKRRRQVTLNDPRLNSSDSRIGVSAPKMFAFDQVFSKYEEQRTVVTTAVCDILQAVLAGNDGCILGFGGSETGKTYTMIGPDYRTNEFGVMPCAISWLYRSMAELKARNNVRFSVRISAVTVDASGRIISDVLSEHAHESDRSPVFLRGVTGGILSSAAELRAPSVETAARYLDLALSTRFYQRGPNGNFLPPSTFLFSLNLYQYTVDKCGKGVIAGRSRLNLVDLGDVTGRIGGSLSLSGLNSVLLALFNGQKYLPHKDNRVTQLLQDTIGSLTCHATIIVNVSPAMKHCQHTLVTLQLSSRIHRIRRKKFRGFGNSNSISSSDSSRKRSSSEDTSAGSSSIDFSSSEQSADTVIYIGGGGAGDSTDGEHPPIFLPHHLRRPGALPRLRSLEQIRSHTASPVINMARRPASASPTPSSRSVPLDRRDRMKPVPPPRIDSRSSSSPIQQGFFRHQPGVSHIMYSDAPQQPVTLFSSFKPTKCSSFSALPTKSDIRQHTDANRLSYRFYQEPNSLVPIYQTTATASVQPCSSFLTNSQKPYQTGTSSQKFIGQKHPLAQLSSSDGLQQPRSSEPKRQKPLQTPSDEQWIDGPKISKVKAAAAVRSKSSCGETWIDGPTATRTTYGYMDDHKKTMIERWVAIQSAQVTHSGPSSPKSKTPDQLPEKIEDDQVTESDVDTISEHNTSSETKQPNIIEELEKKNLIPTDEKVTLSENENIIVKTANDSLGSEDFSLEEICSQCEALAEECEELHSLLSCEEDDCKKVTQHGLATVIEEPELESNLGIDDKLEGASLVNHPQTDSEDEDLDHFGISDVEILPVSPQNQSTCESGVQVCQEDILRSLSNTPCPSEDTVDTSDDHPLRVLSEENLTCASNFTDSYSHAGDNADDDEYDDSHLSLLQVPDYDPMSLSFHEDSCLYGTDANLPDLQKMFSALVSHREMALKPKKKDFGVQSDMMKISPNNQLCSSCGKEQNGGNLNEADFFNRNDLTDVRQPANCLPNKCACNSYPCIDIYAIKHFSNETLLLTAETSNQEYNLSPNNNTRSITNPVDNMPQPHYLQSVPFVPKLPFLSTFAENIEASVTRESHRYDYIDKDLECPHYKMSNETNLGDDSDCQSVFSDDSEYVISNSKFSKFLCVGIGRRKSKSSKSKSNSKSDIKRSKSKENKNKNRENSKSPQHESKNLKRSPSQIISDNFQMGNSSGRIEPSETNVNECVKNVYSKEKCGMCSRNRIDTYDSGLDSTLLESTSGQDSKAWTGTQSQPIKRILHSTATSSSVATSQSLAESSGYESIPRDSECSSFSSSQESEMDDEHKKESKISVIRRLCSTRPKINAHTDAWGDRTQNPAKAGTKESKKSKCRPFPHPVIKTVSTDKASVQSLWSYQSIKKGVR